MLRARSLLTMTPGSAPDAVCWVNGQIRTVGPARLIEREAPAGIPRYELPDALVTPGVVDGHTHFGLWAQSRQRVQLSGLHSRRR